MRRRTMAGAALAAGLLTAAVLGAGGRAGADAAAAVTGVGWWTRQPAAGARNGGFQVASAPDGAFSEAAVRVRVDSPSLTKAVLVLTEGGGLRQDAAAIEVCATSATWGAADPGPWDQVPKADCQSRAVKLARNPAQSSWSGDVLPLLGAAGGSGSLVIVPAAAATPVDVGFQVDFTAAALTAEGAPPVAPASDVAGGPNPSTDVAPASAAPGATSSPSVPAALAPAPTALASPAATSEPAPSPPAPTAPAEPAGLFPSRRTAHLSGHSRVRWARLLLVVPLSAAVVAAGAFGHRTWREPSPLLAGWRLPWSKSG